MISTMMFCLYLLVGVTCILTDSQRASAGYRLSTTDTTQARILHSNYGERSWNESCVNGSGDLAAESPLAPPATVPGVYSTVGMSGVPAMHAGLMQNGRVFFLDKVENYTQLQLSDGEFAYSAEYDPETNEVVPLRYQYNPFGSGGSFLPDGLVISVGGNAPNFSIDPTVGDGSRVIRSLHRSATDPSLTGQSWSEPGNKLNTPRWHASVASLPEGFQLVCSGSLNGLDPTNPINNNPTYELLNSSGISITSSILLPLLTTAQPYHMYPHLHLLSSGAVFILASKSSILFNSIKNITLSTLPSFPGYHRTYPNTASSVLLPLSSANNYSPSILICGGGVAQSLSSLTDPACGLISPLAPNANWELDSMPTGRTMMDGILLPDGTVLFLNGCSRGAQGFNLATNPAYTAWVYNSSQPLGQRWAIGGTSTIARMDSSIAVLLLDGTVLVAGSNPNAEPVLKSPSRLDPEKGEYATEFRVEVYTPHYLLGGNEGRRPMNVILSTTTLLPGQGFTAKFTAPEAAKGVKIMLYHGGFVTSGMHMNQRMVELDTEGFVPGQAQQSVTALLPVSANVVPPLPYVVYVVVDGVPGMGTWVSVL